MPSQASDFEVGPDVHGFMVLCDTAQIVNNKLYMLGGGWNVADRSAGISTDCPLTVAVKLTIPWDLANHRLKIRVQMLDGNGRKVSLGGGHSVEQVGELEVTRGPGLPLGTPLSAIFVVPLELSDLKAGQYVFELSVSERIIATESLLIR